MFEYRYWFEIGECMYVLPFFLSRKTLTIQTGDLVGVIYDLLLAFQEKLVALRILEPACGSGNFPMASLSAISPSPTAWPGCFSFMQN